MRIVFFGEDTFSMLALDSLVKANHEIISVYCPIYDNLIYSRLMRYCKEMQISFKRISNFNDDSFKEEFNQLEPDLLVICHFQKLIDKTLINIPKFGSINLHPSLLPFYRGMSPQHWPIINGDKETGVTVHFVDEGIDTGDIIIQKKILIRDNWYVSDLQNNMKPIYSHIVKEAVDILSAGNRTYTVQRNLKGSYYGRLKINHCQLCLVDSSIQAYNIIKAVSFPYYGARFNNLIIWKAELFNSKSDLFSKFSEQNIGLFETRSGEKFIKFNDGLIKILKSEQI